MGNAIERALTREEEVCRFRRKSLRRELGKVEERLELLHLALAELDEARELIAAHEGSARPPDAGDEQ